MIKINIIFIFVLLLSSCQREKLNELGVDYNKSLIIPPTYDLPAPGSKKEEEINKINEMLIGNKSNIAISDNKIVDDILKKTNRENSNDQIRSQIDYETGYKNEEGFFRWLLKGKSKRDKKSNSEEVIDPFNEIVN